MLLIRETKIRQRQNGTKIKLVSTTELHTDWLEYYSKINKMIKYYVDTNRKMKLALKP